MPGISKTDAYITGVGLSLISLIMAVFHAPAYFLPTRCGVHLRIAAGSLVYRKVCMIIRLIPKPPPFYYSFVSLQIGTFGLAFKCNNSKEFNFTVM